MTEKQYPLEGADSAAIALAQAARNAAQNIFDPLIDADPAAAENVPTIDHLMADDLKPDDIVVIDGKLHKFVHKEPGPGPHVFLNADDQVTARFYTGELIRRMNDGSYIRPGGSTTLADDLDKLTEADKQRLRMLLQSVRAKPRKKAQIRWLYVGHFINKINVERANGVKFNKNEENAKLVTAEVDDMLAAHNADKSPDQWLLRPKCCEPRTVLNWVANELKRRLGEIGLVHANALKDSPKRLPRQVFEIIATTLREFLTVSGRLRPEKLFRLVRGKIREHNEMHPVKLPLPGKTTVRNEFIRYDPWIRLAVLYGAKHADLEFGAVGKLVRPTRILDLSEIDHHLFDFHGTLGKSPFGKTPFAANCKKAGIDRFWVTEMTDVASGYPLGFALSFEPGGLLAATACVDHAVRMKTYVRERWPHINGDLLGYGKPVRLRYDNAKEFVKFQMGAMLARIGVGFETSIPGVPNSKPYIERKFGTAERDFVEFLKGSTGSNVKEKGPKIPQVEACVSFGDFEMLWHQYQIECYGRRPQEALGWRTPEQVWMEGATDSTTRPRSLTKAESARLDIICSIQLELNITRDGIRWKNLFYQSHLLQELRRKCGAGVKTKPTPVNVRIPLKDIGKMFVADPNPNRTGTGEIVEIEVPCTNPHVAGLTHWQHKVVLAELARRKMDPENFADYERGYLRLFKAALTAMGVQLPGEPAVKNVRLTGGQAPRFVGIFMPGADKPALHRVTQMVQKRDLLGQIAQVLAAAPKEKAADPARARAIDEMVGAMTADPLLLDEIGFHTLTNAAVAGQEVIRD
jgi:transposase InsO family protein